MEAGELELADVDDERARAARKRRNDAFRRRLQEQRAARKGRRLMFVSAAAFLTWTFALFRYFG